MNKSLRSSKKGIDRCCQVDHSLREWHSWERKRWCILPLCSSARDHTLDSVLDTNTFRISTFIPSPVFPNGSASMNVALAKHHAVIPISQWAQLKIGRAWERLFIPLRFGVLSTHIRIRSGSQHGEEWLNNSERRSEYSRYCMHLLCEILNKMKWIFLEYENKSK